MSVSVFTSTIEVDHAFLIIKKHLHIIIHKKGICSIAKCV